ncbi:STAS domain-containing protein [Magnetospirillum sp. 64-120]|uniref:STAS domain-containing protein n=1 Tax=Magnetospirillum sp. 64-120 TaxID=1895778 RepID=UPI0025BEB393|nr:STAS domain-containing protein [Magnetospirillum sp. 64-120]
MVTVAITRSLALFPSRKFAVLSGFGPQGKHGPILMEINEQNGRLVIELPAVLDLPVAAELRDLLIDAAARDTSQDVVLNFANLERISTAGIQVILSAASALRAVARRLVVESLGDTPVSAFRTLGLSAELTQLLDS